MKRLDKQQILIILGALAMLVGFGFIGYYPLISKGDKADLILEERRNVRMQTDSLTAQLPVIQEQIEALSEYDGLYEKRVPRNSQAVAHLWGRIGDLMNEHNLAEQVIEPGVEERGKDLTVVPITLKCSGSTSQIFEFFMSLQELERLIRIERVQLKNDSESSGRVTMTAEAKVYHRSV